MKKFIGILLAFACFLGSLPGVAHASNFTVLADTGLLNLGDDEKWEKTYKTDQGKFKVRFRKLWNSSEKKRFHLIIWWDDKRIADGYCPKNDSGYSFHIYQENESGRIFVALETTLRVVLMGYEPWNGRLEKYIDSKDYYSSGPYPKLHLDRHGDLRLSYSNERWQRCNDYIMTWDEDARWFAYRDPAAAYARESYEEPEYEPEETETNATETAAPAPASAPPVADKSVMEDELYYTEAASKT
ncbi:MAG: hypothetical protein J6Z82_00405 [Schwartzia sp.]|nr:hypothetical protein [Schwartzia sp. (in: firmicutes)]